MTYDDTLAIADILRHNRGRCQIARAIASYSLRQNPSFDLDRFLIAAKVRPRTGIVSMNGAKPRGGFREGS